MRGRLRVPKLGVKLIDFTDCDIALESIMWRNGGEVRGESQHEVSQPL